MPFKSEAQRRKFAEMVKQGTMKQSVFDEWNKDTHGHLPERLKSKTRASGTLSALGAKMIKKGLKK